MHAYIISSAGQAISTRQGKWRQQSLQQRLRGSRYNRVTKGRPTIPKSLIGVGCERCEAEKSWIHPSDIAHRSKPLELEEARSAKSKTTTSVIEGGFFVRVTTTEIAISRLMIMTMSVWRRRGAMTAMAVVAMGWEF